MPDAKTSGDHEQATRDAARDAARDAEAEPAIVAVGSLDIDVADGLRSWRSPGYLRLHGLAPDMREETHADWRARVHPDDRERAERVLFDALEGDALSYAGEYRIIRPSDGEVRWIHARADIERDAQGRARRLAGAHIDVTAQKRVEDALRASEARLRSAVEVGRVGLWDWDMRTGEIHWSDEHYRMVGYAVGEVGPSYEAWVARIHPDDRVATEAALRHAMDARQDYAHEFRALHPDGTVRWLDARGRFSHDAAGRPVRMIGAMIDTTEPRAAAERQKVLVAELQHRTRNLLAVVRSMAEKSIRASADLPAFRERFGDRLDALGRAQGFLSRLDEHDRVTFDELVRAELSALDADPGRTVLEGPPGVRLRSSSVQTLALALHELATNAVKHGALGQPAGRLAITWSVAPSDESKPWLHIDWRESGVAMPPAPIGRGQGRELIERALPYQLDARTTYTPGPDGVHCTIAVPVSESIGHG